MFVIISGIVSYLILERHNSPFRLLTGFIIGPPTDFKNKGLEKAVTDYLVTQKDFAWQVEENSHNFCAIKNLGFQETFPLYIWAFCKEFTFKNGKVESASGMSAPATIYYSGKSAPYDLTKFSYELAMDGSAYSPSIKKMFPKNAQIKAFSIHDSDTGKMEKELQAKATAYFQKEKGTSNKNNAEYKTYKNEIIGIEFQYPSSWPTLSDGTPGDTMKDGKIYNSFTMNLIDSSHLGHTYMNYDNQPIDKQYEKIKCQKNDPGTIECEEKVSSNGTKYVWEIEKTLGGPDYQAMVATGKYILIFDFQDKENYEKRADEYQKMLSGLKIVE
jgi:hypothetical protein